MAPCSTSDDEYEPEYEPERFTIDGRFSVEVLAVVPPPLEYMSTLHTQNQEISGRQVWCGSLLLASVLANLDATYMNGKRVLELGSGTGLVGMVASKLGDPTCVVLTDGDSDALNLLQQNLENPYNAMDKNITKATLLRWGSNVDEFCKWCRQTFSGDTNKFDLILAGDVMYKHELPKLFFETVHSLLSETGTLLLCHVPRARVTHDVVRTAAQECGFDIEEFDSSDIRVENCAVHDRERAIVYQVVRTR